MKVDELIQIWIILYVSGYLTPICFGVSHPETSCLSADVFRHGTYRNIDFSKNEALSDLWQMLEERKIYPQRVESVCSDKNIAAKNEDKPTGDVSDLNKAFRQQASGYPQRNYKKGKPDKEIQLADNDIVEVGDTVVYVDTKYPEDEKQALITRDRSNPEWGTMNIRTPIAQALLGAQSEDIVEAKLPMGSVQLLIKQINTLIKFRVIIFLYIRA